MKRGPYIFTICNCCGISALGYGAVRNQESTVVGCYLRLVRNEPSALALRPAAQALRKSEIYSGDWFRRMKARLVRIVYHMITRRKKYRHERVSGAGVLPSRSAGWPSSF